MVQPNTHNDQLSHALARLVFNAGLNDDDVAERVAGITRLATPYRLKQLRDRLDDGEIAADAAAKRLIELGLARRLSDEIGITNRNFQRRLLQKLQEPDQNESELIAAARALSNTSDDSQEDSDKTAAKKLIEIARHVAASENDGGNDPETEDSDMNDLIEKLLEIVAFDEARLPKNLHYDTDDDGNAIPSDGQRNFLTGTENALVKLGVDVDPDPGGASDPAVEAWLTTLTAVASILLLDGHYDPDDRAFYDHVRAAHTELLEPASTKRGEIVAGNDQFETNFRLKHDVFAAVRKVLQPGEQAGGEKIFFHALAAVFRGMVAQYDTRPPGSAGFPSTVKALYSEETLAGGGGDGGGSGIAYLDLPPLSDPEGGSEQIVPENIRAISAIYVVYQCEQILLFDVVDRIVELFMAGLYPMGGDVLARTLDNYYWSGEDRVSKTGRDAQYARALGAPGGDAGGDVTPNTPFNPALMHVISSLSEFERQRNIGNMFEQKRGYSMGTTGEYVRKAVRDLAANCTLYGYAGAQFAAERLARHLKKAMEILQLPRIQEIYGVKSMWQVIERVAQSEFGTTINVVKHRTLAEETRAILEIIAEKHHVWSLSSDRPLFTIGGVPGDLTEAEGDRMFRASQYFLAVNGFQNEQVYEYSQPTDTPALPSIPGMGSFGGGAIPGANGGGGDVARQLKEMLDSGQTPSADQIRSIAGF